jgi:hypothetical protein
MGGTNQRSYTMPLERIIAELMEEHLDNHMPTQFKLDIIANLAMFQILTCPDVPKALEAFIQNVRDRVAET